MKVNPHLTDEELTELLLDDQAAAAEHVKACAPCQAEVHRLRHATEALRDNSNQALSEDFWQRQRTAIWTRLSSPPGQAPQSIGWAWATAAALAIIAALLLGHSPAPAPPRASVDPDHELLLAVERAVQSHGPQALEPAALLAQEMTRTAQSTSPVNREETNHEN